MTYDHGLWVNSVAAIYYNCTQFTATLGLDDSDEGAGAVVYEFFADGTQVYDSGVVIDSAPTVQASVNVTGAQTLEIVDLRLKQQRNGDRRRPSPGRNPGEGET